MLLLQEFVYWASAFIVSFSCGLPVSVLNWALEKHSVVALALHYYVFNDARPQQAKL